MCSLHLIVHVLSSLTTMHRRSRPTLVTQQKTSASLVRHPRMFSCVALPVANLTLTDIDGDGRADYCLVDDNGDVRCSRNGGQGDKAAYWQGFSTENGVRGVVFKGKNKGDKRGTRFGKSRLPHHATESHLD